MMKTSEASEARDEESDDGAGEPELRFPKHRSQALLNIESMIYQKIDRDLLGS
ncbi:unnamed protein product [Prunus brigantina]